MSKNIIIQEGGTNYQFTAKKLKTDKVGGGSVLWVPEEETTLKKIRITEEGTYRASDEGYYGYSEVVVDVTGHGSLKTKRITQNGTYKAEDDGLMGYSKVKVNVRGGNGSADSSGKPRTTFDSDGNIEDAPGGIGSAVFGTDPNTGEWVAVGVDSGGNLVTTPIPAGIEIVTPPTKTSYAEGETINYSGIAVNLKTKAGGTFTNATYPNGRIPMQELIFPVDKAHGGGASSYDAIDGYSFSTDFNVAGYDKRTEILFIIDETAEAGTTYSAGGLAYNKISDNYAEVTYNGTLIHSGSTRGSGTTSAYWARNPNNKSANLGYYYDNTRPAIGFATPIPLNDTGIEIPVQWKSSYDGRTFEDTFEITVTGASGTTGDTGGTTGDTSSGSGYSDDSGGSSSGGGGGF